MKSYKTCIVDAVTKYGEWYFIKETEIFDIFRKNESFFLKWPQSWACGHFFINWLCALTSYKNFVCCRAANQYKVWTLLPSSWRTADTIAPVESGAELSLVWKFSSPSVWLEMLKTAMRLKLDICSARSKTKKKLAQMMLWFDGPVWLLSWRKVGISETPAYASFFFIENNQKQKLWRYK